ncbi:MAG: restriction endonuclease subunit S [Planctomycetia bacterium]|nr:restriction endonuclease subunit S [Planctomycetia bacterium]
MTKKTNHNWQTKKLGEVSKINYGYTEKASFKGIGPKFLRITDIQDNCVDWETVPFCKIGKNALYKYLLSEGDIVFARTGATTGKSFLLTNPPLAVFASYLIKLRILDLEILAPEFLFLFFQTKTYWDKIETGLSGSAQGGFNATKLAEISVPLPPLSEQQRIVAILDEAFAAITTAKENAEKNLQNARELFESYLQSVFANPGDGWEEKTLGECFKLKSGDNITSKMMIENGKYPVYGGNGIAGMYNKFNLSGSNVIVGRVGALCGNVRHIEEAIWLTDNGFKITDCKYDFDNAFLAYLLNLKNLRNYARQAAQPVISNSSLEEVLLQFPKSLKDQKSIVTKLDALSAETKKLEAIYRQKLADLDELKKSVLQKAFTGQLTMEN